MPGISLSALRDNQVQVRIRFGNESLKISIYPDRLTNDVMDRYREASEDEPKDYDEMAAAFAEFVESWDLLGDDGKPLPINGETFRVVSIRILNHIWAELVEAVTPKSRKKNERS